MSSGPDIFRAKLLINQHSEDAPLCAAGWGDELLEIGDMIEAVMCRQILGAIKELLCGRREGERIN